jgi:TPR repeat protein
MEIIKFDLEKMKQKQDGFSYYILGRSYDLEENGASQNYNVALDYYQKGNELGYPLCAYSLGISYVLGLGDTLKVDKEKGKKLLVEAYPKIVELVNSQDTDEVERIYAKFVTGAYHYFGLGNIEKDYKHIAAIYDLGANFYYNGNGTEKNHKLSEYYLKMAKQAGLKRAIDKYEEYEYYREEI